jgi:hypothetical protein
MPKKYIEGDVNLSKRFLTELPDFLSDVAVRGSFKCDSNKLTNLIGGPKIVGGSYSCKENRLTSLEGAPDIIEGSFYCGKNRLTSLEGGPTTVTGFFDCSNNILTSLEGCPTSVGGNFTYYHFNEDGKRLEVRAKFTEEDIRAVCDVKGSVLL